MFDALNSIALWIVRNGRGNAMRFREPGRQRRIDVWLCLLAVAWGVPGPCSAQRPSAAVPDITTIPIIEGRDIRFQTLFNRQNLSHVRVESIVQDTQGFMWFGTWNGLNRYDGYKYKLFKHEAGDAQSLSGVYIYTLFKDHRGNLWIGTDGFVDRFHPETESFTHYKLETPAAERLSNIVNHISEDSSGMLWVSTRNGLFRLDPNSGELKNYLHDSANSTTLADNEIKSSGEDRRGNFWVATSRSLDEFDRQAGKVKRHIEVGESGIGLLFHEDRFGVFWVIYGSPGYIATLDRKTNRLTRFEYAWKPGPPRANQAYALLEDSQGTMWFGTAGAGLMKFDRQNRCFISYRHDPDNPEAIGDKRVISLFEDREGNIWTGLHQKEPNYFPIRPPMFENPSRLAQSSQRELSGLVTGIYEDGRGEVWLGANRRLYHINRKTGQLSLFEGVDNSEVNSIIADGADVLWFGNAYPGLLRYNTKTGERKGYRHNRDDPTTLCSGVIDDLLIDRQGTLWAATWDGLCQLDSSRDRFTKYTPSPDSRGLNYYTIAQGPDGALWLGGNVGLHRFDPQSKTFTVYAHNPQDPTSISDDHINAVFFDRSGILWVGTQNGLDKFDPATRTFKSYDRRNGLSGTVISCILQDRGGTLWMSTDNGISSFDMSSVHFANYTAADGLPGPDLTGMGTCYESSRGEMFFAGFSGATAFFPDKVAEKPYTPRPVLTDFRLFGSSVVPGRGSPLKTAINWTSFIELSHSENILSIEFSALSYLNPETNRYRYKLDGVDKGWREVGSDERLASYTTLPAGNRTFRLEAATSRGPWSPDLVLEIRILPPFWQTYWFLTCFAAALCGLLGLLYRLRLNQLSAQFNIRTEERVAERTRIARELHDTLLQSFQALVIHMQTARNLFPRRPDEAIQTLDNAIGSAEQAIDEGRSTIQELRTTPKSDLPYLLTIAAQEIAKTQDSNGTEPVFGVRVTGTRRTLSWVLQDEVYLIGREALRNAFQHGHASHIEAEIIYGNRDLRLRIRDDGKGVDRNILKEGARAGHWGLPGARERAKRIGGRFNIWSELGAGTEIELTVPASRAYARHGAQRRFGLFRKKKDVV
jgi:ligand-binding sensor domain-containing protein